MSFYNRFIYIAHNRRVPLEINISYIIIYSAYWSPRCYPRDRPPAAAARGSRFIPLVYYTLFVVNHKSTADATIVYLYITDVRNAYPRQNANSSGIATGLPRRAHVIIMRRGRIAKCAFRLYISYGHDAFMVYCNILHVRAIIVFRAHTWTCPRQLT